MDGAPERSSLRGARVVLGVSGGVSAYKAIEVCRRLMDAGAAVSPVLTEDALRFVTELTFSAVAAEPTRVSLWDAPEPSPHTHLARMADLVLVAPATARMLAAYATGSSDGLLTATLLATRAPVLVCPAMHTEMWEHPAVQANVATLRGRGVTVLDPDAGHLAGGDVGVGRLPEPARIVDAAAAVLARRADLAGVSLLVTAGGTREPIDPVRYIGNRSSGKQGYALAEAAAARGATVTLVSTAHRSAPAGVTLVRVDTAAQMHDAVLACADAQVVVMAAAVADFRPVAAAAQKIKKDPGSTEAPVVVLERTPDILAALGERKAPGQLLVGFAAETEQLLAHAHDKLRRKRLDLIVANDVSAPGVGFEHDTNAVTLIEASGACTTVALASKAAIADAVLDAVVRLRGEGAS